MSQEIPKNFEQKRLISENENYLCQLIREDSIEEFIIYVNKHNISLDSRIISSIFETNSLLLKKAPTLIEYSAFFGSIQIFQYLHTNGVELKPSLWIYSIHSKNAEMIHLLEENNVKPDDNYLKESSKCYHNEITNYIIESLMNKDEINQKIDENFDENILSYCFHYYNYNYFPSDLNAKFIFFYACQYDYCNIVES